MHSSFADRVNIYLPKISSLPARDSRRSQTRIARTNDMRGSSNAAMLALAAVLLAAGMSGSAAQSTCAQIPKCAAGSCSIKTLNAQTVTICSKCQPGYFRVNGGRACVCKPGYYDTDSSAGCSPCGRGNYCPAVAATYVSKTSETAAQRGSRFACDKGSSGSSGLTTANAVATSWKACVTKPGYALASSTGAASVTESTQTSAVCGANKYNLGGNRLMRCNACQAGLVTVGTTAADHDNPADCMVPAGRYWDSSDVKLCPLGSWRSGILPAQQATACESCGVGIMTDTAGSTDRTACTIVEAGYGAVWDPNGFAKDAVRCDFGSFWPGGTYTSASTGGCMSCNGYTTRNTGATSRADCIAPPGYYLDGNDQVLTPCPNSVTATEWGVAAAYGSFGTYRSGWAVTPRGKRDCIVCGANMPSENVDGNEHPEDDEVAARPLVAASSSACYITAGQGLIKDGTLDASVSQLRAMDCPANSYGVVGTTQGLNTSPCKSCERGLITDGNLAVAGRNSPDVCINPAGFGMTGKMALQCPQDAWAARASLIPCTSCGSEGRTTTGVPIQQAAQTDCYVRDGFGVYDQSGTTEDDQFYTSTAASTQLGSLSDAQKAALDVTVCPLHRYSDSTNTRGEIAARCVRCPDYSGTGDVGSTSASDCTTCFPGYGRSAASGACSSCPRGRFNDGKVTNPITQEDRPDWSCLTCPVKTFAYPNRDAYTIAGTTAQIASTSMDQCVPVNSQLEESAGTTIFSGYIEADAAKGVSANAATDLAQCVAACEADAACHLAEFRYDDLSHDYSTGCFLFNPAAGSTNVFYKLPQSQDVAASAASAGAVSAQSVASGFYAKQSFDASVVTPAFGDSLDTKSSAGEAAAACNMDSTCWGFVQQSANVFVLRTGSLAANVRTIVNVLKTADDTATNTGSRVLQP